MKQNVFSRVNNHGVSYFHGVETRIVRILILMDLEQRLNDVEL
jgi:hypothetical protein